MHIIINNFNRVTLPSKLITQLQDRGHTSIHIIDNNSTYPPLLEWYNANPLGVTIKRLASNMGPLALYNSGYISEFRPLPWIAYTDSDILLGENTPRDFLDQLVHIAEKHSYSKVGLALRHDDLPDNYYGNYSAEFEKRFWTDPIEPDIYRADIDTTFAIIRPRDSFRYTALRVGKDFTAIHGPWYTDFENLDTEEQYYIDNTGPYSTYKAHYNTFMQNK